MSDASRPSEYSPSAADHLEARQRKSPSAAVVHEAIRLEGEEELRRPSSSLAWSGLAAGLTMGFSLVAEGILRAKLPDAPWRDLVTSLGYTAGFLFVTLGRQQLFTETTLTASLPALHDSKRLPDTVRFWVIVFAANIVGTLLFAGLAATPGLFNTDLLKAYSEIGFKAAERPFSDIFLRGVPGGWLVALMLWLLPYSGAGRILVIIFVTYIIAAGELVHVIAGSVEAAHAAVVGAISWWDYGQFLLAALLGNAVGGVVFVALLNHAQANKEL